MLINNFTPNKNLNIKSLYYKSFSLIVKYGLFLICKMEGTVNNIKNKTLRYILVRS